MPKCFIIQQPRYPDSYDLEACRKLGEINYVMPAAPNVHDQDRVNNDFQRMCWIMDNLGPQDVFVAMGGSPFSNAILGAAMLATETAEINVGLYSRPRDNDGRRGLTNGEYRVVKFRLPLEAHDSATLERMFSDAA